MEVLIDDLLFLSGPLKGKEDLQNILNVIRPFLIVSLRPRTDTSHWYEEKIHLIRASAALINSDMPRYEWPKVLLYCNYDPDTTHLDIEFFNLEIHRQSVFIDPGNKASKGYQKHRTVSKLCNKIVDFLNEKKPVVVISPDGRDTAGYFLKMCTFWYFKSLEKTVPELLKDCRDSGDFNTGKTKEQREQMEGIREYIMGIENWKKAVKKC
jgi:hypothetical protein